MDCKWAVLFDLDQTLVLTANIEHLRRKRAWQEVYRAFNRTSLPPGTQSFVKSVARIARLGIITTSPRPYAEKLLAHHKLDIPVIIAYHDVFRRKPYPDSIIKASEYLGIPPRHTIYIGDLVDDILAASGAGAFPIGISWDGTLRCEPTASNAYALCDNWDEVGVAISKIKNLLLEWESDDFYLFEYVPKGTANPNQVTNLILDFKNNKAEAVKTIGSLLIKVLIRYEAELRDKRHCRYRLRPITGGNSI